MTDRDKLLVALLGEAADDAEAADLLEIAAMLFELGADYRRYGLRPLVAAAAPVGAGR